jgi:DNA-binding response OmpR family regulator
MSRPAHEKRHIVIVDDDALVRESVKLSLEHEGFAASVVEDASTAVASIRARKPDLVILDMYMPGADGREIARALKVDPSTSKIPLVFFTASNEAVDVVTGLDAGAVEYIAKPIDGEILVSKIRHILKLDAR